MAAWGFLLNRLAPLFSEGRWTSASCTLAYFALLLAPHRLGYASLLEAFDGATFTKAAGAIAIVDDAEEFQQRMATRLGKTHRFCKKLGTAFSCV